MTSASSTLAAAVRVGAAVALLATLASACTLVQLADDTTAYDSATVLVGRVDMRDPARAGPVVVGAYARDGSSWRLLHQTRLHEPGGYELIVPRGEAVVFAFADRNGNGLHDADEPAAQVDGGRPVRASGRGMVGALDMTLGAATGIAVPRLAPAPPHSTQAGALADLDASAFSADAGAQGYWQPTAFFRAHGGNVLFLEPYDSAKVPVLFVHGAGGSPQDWREQIRLLDRARYQPWLYFYPSGAAVESMSHLLYWKLLNLQLRYRFDRLAIVAHSMGGLVVRRFALDHGAQFPQWRLFVSLSTPWSGDPAADAGVKYSPAVVPSWHDMQPDGPFMRSLFERRLPDGLEYDLLFGHKGGYSMLRPNNDGAVTLASQLRRAAQTEARLVFGFDEDHVGILRSPQVAAQLGTLLDGRLRDAAPAGRVRLDLRADGDAPKGVFTLVLRAADATRPPISVALSAADAQAPLGPLPEGLFDAALLADGFVAEPRSQRVRIGGQALPALPFRLRPQGMLAGYVGDGRARAAGSFIAPHPDLRIRSIMLAGAGVQRTLVPRGGELAGALERLVAGADVAWGTSFTFVDLPAGEYDLTIEANGHATHRSRHRVVPGSPGTLEPITLQPLR